MNLMCPRPNRERERENVARIAANSADWPNKAVRNDVQTHGVCDYSPYLARAEALHQVRLMSDEGLAGVRSAFGSGNKRSLYPLTELLTHAAEPAQPQLDPHHMRNPGYAKAGAIA